jgi:hypothetical protein
VSRWATLSASVVMLHRFPFAAAPFSASYWWWYGFTR